MSAVLQRLVNPEPQNGAGGSSPSAEPVNAFGGVQEHVGMSAEHTKNQYALAALQWRTEERFGVASRTVVYGVSRTSVKRLYLYRENQNGHGSPELRRVVSGMAAAASRMSVAFQNMAKCNPRGAISNFG
jgi:hypothetical protein